MINGQIHAWEDIKIFLNGVPVAGITDINFNDAREVEAIYGAGAKPIGAGLGNYSVEGDFTLTKDAADLFEAAAKALGKSVYDYKPFQIVVSYDDRNADGSGPLFERSLNPLRTETITDVIIERRERARAQNDKSVGTKYTFKAREVK